MHNRIYSFDVLKFFAIFAIALAHFHWQSSPQAYLGVELCFIITGFFISKNSEKYYKDDLLATTTNRIKGFYPYYVIIVFTTAFFVEKSFHLDRIISQLLFFPHIGLAPKDVFPLWFLGVYTYVFALYMCILRMVDKAKIQYFVGLLVIGTLMLMMKTSPAMNINITLEREYFIGFIPFGVARGIVGIGLGFLLGSFAEGFKKNPFSQMATIVELFSLCYLAYIVLHKVTPRFDLIAYVLISTLIFSLSFKNSFLSKLLETLGKKFKRIFSLSMQIYIYHGLIIKFFGKYLITNFKAYNLYLIIYLLSVFMLCISIRYLYENFYQLCIKLRQKSFVCAKKDKY